MVFQRTVLGLGVVLLSLMCVAGCSKDGSSPTNDGGGAVQDAQGVLDRVQGSWSLAQTNDLAKCTALFNGLRVALAYRHAGDETLVRRNVLFSRIEPARGLLVMEGVGGAWPYQLGPGSEGERLRLEFYCESCAAWHKVELRR